MTQIGSLLRAAAEIVGGTRELAARLGLGERLLARFIAEEAEVPDHVLLHALDIILADRQARSASGPTDEISLPPIARRDGTKH